MSISSFFNSPQPEYSIKNLFSASASTAQTIPVDAAYQEVEAIQTVAGDDIVLSVPAGTYNCTMSGGVNPNNAASQVMGSGYFILVDIDTATVYGATNANSYNTTGASVISLIRQTVRIVLPPKSPVANYNLQMKLGCSQVGPDDANLAFGDFNGVDTTASLTLRPTF